MSFPRLFSILLILFIAAGCDKGIAPVPEPGFGGTIFFSGQWPGNVTRTHLVVFENPLTSPSDFSILNLKYIGNEIPSGTLEYKYSSLDSSLVKIGAGTYRYIAVAQSSTPVLSLNREDWYVIGVYNTGNPSIPAQLTIQADKYTDNVNIYCDFNNLPPQPPGGTR